MNAAYFCFAISKITLQRIAPTEENLTKRLYEKN